MKYYNKLEILDNERVVVSQNEWLARVHDLRFGKSNI